MLTVLRQPKWIIVTLLVPVAIVLCLRAAQWQYDRHVERSERSDLVTSNAATEPAQISTLVAPGEALRGESQFLPVVVSGEFDADGTVLVRKRVLEGKTGYWVVSPLQTGNGTLQVLRGFVPTAGDALTSPQVPPPPTGSVTVYGWLEPSQQNPSPAPTDLPPGQVAALDTTVLNASTTDYQPYLVAMAMNPADTAAVRTLPVPDPGVGPHLAYSWQWIAFALLIPVGWVILLRRELRPDDGAPTSSPDDEFEEQRV